MTEVAIYRPGELDAAVPPPSGPLDDWIMVADKVVRLAEVICKSPFVPDGLRGSVAATAAAILTGRELGIPPMTSLANIHVINGKTGLSALVMRALILSKGHEWQDVEVTDTRVKVRGRRRGEAEWTEASFTRDQAQAARIQLGGYPQDKLYARATSRLARRKFADVIAGMPYSAEELDDGDDGERIEPVAAGAPKPAQRTARRRQSAATNGGPAAEPSNERGTRAGGGQTVAGPPQPPLPGEEDTPEPPQETSSPAGQDRPQASGDGGSGAPDDSDYDTPGTVTRPQSSKLHVLFGELGFGKDQRDDRLRVASKVVGRELGSSNDLSKNEAKALIDTLERCGGDYERLSVLLDGQDASAEAGDDANG